jgi:hypothetical protein
VYNCFEITVSNSTFENNGPVTITKFVPIRGHSGGLSIGFYFQEPGNKTELTATIQDSTFRNNSVKASVSGRQSTSQLLTKFLITGRGGGCAVNVHSVISVKVFVSGCVFERNHALSFGGGFYMGWIRVSNHTTNMTDTSFIENMCLGGAGGLELGFGGAGGSEKIANNFFASNLHFVGNKATYGGGTYIFGGCKYGCLWTSLCFCKAFFLGVCRAVDLGTIFCFFFTLHVTIIKHRGRSSTSIWLPAGLLLWF